MIWNTYILECVDGSYYVGISSCLEKRAIRHNKKDGARYTRGRVPVRLVWSEEYSSRAEAMKRETEIKKWSHKKKEELIAWSPSLLSGHKNLSLRSRTLVSRYARKIKYE